MIIRSKWFRRTLIGGVVTVLVVGVAGFGILPPLLKDGIARAASDKLQRKVTLDNLSINPFTLTAQVQGLTILDRDGSRLAHVDSALLDLQLSSVWYRGPVLREISVERPYLHLVRTGANQYNISDIVERFLAEPTPPERPRFSLNNISIRHGQIDIDDQPESTRHTVSNLELGLPFISSLPNYVQTFITPGLSASIDGAPLVLKVQSRPFSASHESSVALNLDGLDLAHFVKYLPVSLKFHLLGAKLDTHLNLAFRQGTASGSEILLSGDLGLRDLALEEPDHRPLLSLKAGTLRLGKSNLLVHQLHVEDVALNTLDLHLQREADGRTNLARVFQREPAPDRAAPATPATRPWQISLRRSTLQNSVLHWDDASVKPAFAVTLSAIGGELKDLNWPETRHPASLSLTAVSNRGETLRHQGRIHLDPLDLQGHVELVGVNAEAYPAYTGSLLKAALGGKVDLQGDYSIRPGAIVFEHVGAALHDLSISQPGAGSRMLLIPALTLREARVDMQARTAMIGMLQSQGARLAVNRARDGSLDWARLFPAPASTASPGDSPPAFLAQVQSVQLSDYGVTWQDALPPQPVRLAVSQLALKASGLSNRPGQAATLDLSMLAGKRGRIALSGQLTPTPLQSSLKLDVAGLDLVSLQPYFGELLNIELTRGWAGAHGRLVLSAASPLRTSYRGSVNVTDFHSVDKLNAADFLSWKSLYLNKMNVATAPGSVVIGEVALTDFYSRLILNANRRMNLQDIVVQDGVNVSPTQPQPAKPAVAAAAPDTLAAVTPVRIDKVTLSGGNIQFSDFFIKPNYSVNLTRVAGAISGLSTDAATRATLELTGSVDDTAPVEVKGSLNPLARQLFIDLKGSVRNFELTSTTPYSHKYIGYGIEKGKLSMDVSYFIDKQQLKAENSLFLDQLTFGERVDSPDAVSLPVKLAVSLLTDRNGQIKVRVPIAGSLDDPQFSYGGIVWQVIVNIFEKAVSSPFTLLSSAFGGGEELAHAEFDAGRASLSLAAKQNLDNLAQALVDRPAIRLDIGGWADPETDTAGLRQVRLAQQMLAVKLKSSLNSGESLESDEVKISDAEYPGLLKTVYQHASFPKPRTVIGLPKTLALAEMEQLLLANIPVTDSDLLALADRRSQAVRAYLSDSANIAAERIFLTAPEVAGKNKPRDGSPRQAEFVLK